MLAAHITDITANRIKDEQIKQFKQTLNDKDGQIKSLQQQLHQKDELIKSLELELLHPLKDRHSLSAYQPKISRHHRQKSMTKMATETSTIENVRWELRSEITKLNNAENEIQRLLQSVGDTSMISSRLKKIYEIVSVHKRKIFSLEQSLNTDEFGQLQTTPNDGDDDCDLENMQIDRDKLKKFVFAPQNDDDDDEKKDFEILSKQYIKQKLQIAEMKQEENEWNNTKLELTTLNKRCANLMSMLDKLSDEKAELTMQIEDLHAILNKHNLDYRQ